MDSSWIGFNTSASTWNTSIFCDHYENPRRYRVATHWRIGMIVPSYTIKHNKLLALSLKFSTNCNRIFLFSLLRSSPLHTPILLTIIVSNTCQMHHLSTNTSTYHIQPLSIISSCCVFFQQYEESSLIVAPTSPMALFKSVSYSFSCSPLESHSFSANYSSLSIASPPLS